MKNKKKCKTPLFVGVIVYTVFIDQTKREGKRYDFKVSKISNV